MKGKNLTMVVAAFLALSGSALGVRQQGRGQGPYARETDQAVQQIDGRLGMYLNGDEIKNILTPGEFSEWTLKLKAGQVVIAEARSDAFDPALEIVDDKDKVLASNDDRYPGDQRPLLLWECKKDGSYGLRVRCFHDKSGGQFHIRFKTYDTVDAGTEGMVEKEVSANTPFLLKVPMKAGQVKDIVTGTGARRDWMRVSFNTVIFPDGLPERSPSLAEPIAPAIRALIAPVAGDYYLLYTAGGWRTDKGPIQIGAREIAPTPLVKQGGKYSAEAPTNVPALWELSVKAGELLQVSTPGLDLGCKFVLSEAPDFAKYDTSKPETNPFFPQLKVPPQDSPVDVLPARARDGRVTVFRARRDAKLWLATDGLGPQSQQFALHVQPAAAVFAEDQACTGKLKVGNTDYWAIEAKSGDVMTLSTTATGFAEQIVVRDPEMNEIRGTTAGPDETSDKWQMVVQKPGRYLVAVSCLGDGGGGDYSLSRHVFHAKEFGLASPAGGEIKDGQIQIWRFTATPDNPLLIRWNSTNWDYDVAIYDDKGQGADFQRQELDEHNRIGILKVGQPQSFVIVLTGKPRAASYSIALEPIPGYKAAAKSR